MEYDPEFWTTEEYAAKIRRSVDTVRYWRKVGYGPKGFRCGRRVLYVAAEVKAWLAAQQRAGRAA